MKTPRDTEFWRIERARDKANKAEQAAYIAWRRAIPKGPEAEKAAHDTWLTAVIKLHEHERAMSLYLDSTRKLTSNA